MENSAGVNVIIRGIFLRSVVYEGFEIFFFFVNPKTNTVETKRYKIIIQDETVG